jgi:hypothetical protein
LSRKLLYHDPFTNILHWHDYDPSTGKAYHIATGDSQVNKDHATTLRNDDEYRKKSIKNGGMHAVHWPPLVIMEVRQKYGIDVVTQPREAIAIAIEHYPDLLTVPLSSLKGWKKKKITTVV